MRRFLGTKTYPQALQIGRLWPGLSGPHTRSFRVRVPPLILHLY